jgi:hypothetical protein
MGRGVKDQEYKHWEEFQIRKTASGKVCPGKGGHCRVIKQN